LEQWLAGVERWWVELGLVAKNGGGKRDFAAVVHSFYRQQGEGEVVGPCQTNPVADDDVVR
jgi:hypothetical protein